MLNQITVTFAALTAITFGDITPISSEQVLASYEISLENRYPADSVSDIFQDNILLNLAYLSGKVTSKEQINWDEIRQPFRYELTLRPGDVFAFHEDVLPKYQGRVLKTTQSQFNAQQGFKFSGRLYGDGVCHLASLMYLVALRAGLDAEAPTNHNFAKIPQIDKEYGVSIYYNPGQTLSNTRQNLYITNNRMHSIVFRFDYHDNILRFDINELEN